MGIWVLIITKKSYINFNKILTNVGAKRVLALCANVGVAQKSTCQFPTHRASEISAFIRTDGQTDRRTDGQTDMARSTRLVILIKNIYNLWDRKRFVLPVTYFPTNLVYSFTLCLFNEKNALLRVCRVTQPQQPTNFLIRSLIVLGCLL